MVLEALESHALLFLMYQHLLPREMREKILISLYRNPNWGEIENFDELRLFCKRVSLPRQWNPNSFLLSWNSFNSQELDNSAFLNPPTALEFLSRFPLPKFFLRKVISSLQQEDIYEGKLYFPDSKMRQFSLLKQGKAVISLLFYLPEELEKDKNFIESVVHRYFQDSWIVPLYFGTSIDLQQSWDIFPAAKSALNRFISPQIFKVHSKAKILEVKSEKNLK